MTATTHQKPLNAFFRRVGALDRRLAEGLSKLLPDWWDDSLNHSASISQQVILGWQSLRIWIWRRSSILLLN